MKVAIVYDWFDRIGGAERLLPILKETFPKADWYTSYVDDYKAPWAKDFNAHTSFIHKLPAFLRKSRVRSLIFYPFAFESFNFNEYDLVVSATSSYAKGIITRPETKHVSYMFTANRFLWGNRADAYLRNAFGFVAPYKNYLKKWDYLAAQRPDKIFTISKYSQYTIKEYYDRDSEILYPPFDTEYWAKIKKTLGNSEGKSDYYLVVSRLEPYKKIEIAINACKKLDKKLIVIGDGTMEKVLKAKAGPDITFKKNVPDKELAMLYSQAQALLMPQEEDFGYTSLEAQYFGCPVITYRKSGAIETIKESKSGLIFNTQTTESLAKTIEKFESLSYTLHRSVEKLGPEYVRTFSKEHFEKKLRKLL